MGSRVQFPGRISGKWIFLERLKKVNDVSVLMRGRFFMPQEAGDEALLWISANTSYRLFINGRLAGAGPRSHQNTGVSYIDTHEIGFFLEPGNNSVAIQIHSCVDGKQGDRSRLPGMWCQLQCGGKMLLESDETWQLLALENFNLPRARIADKGALNSFFDNRCVPLGWNQPDFVCDERWEAPDMLLSPGQEGCRAELHPEAPAVVAGEEIGLAPVCRGRVKDLPRFSHCLFGPEIKGRTGAAVSYVFCEKTAELRLKLYSDVPFKFFCNMNRIFDGPSARGTEVVLSFVEGFNRLTLFSELHHNSMGIMMTGHAWPEELLPLSDMMETAPPGWCVAGIRRLRFEDCTPAVKIEELPELALCAAESVPVGDIWDLLADSVFVREEGGADGELTEGSVQLFKLPVVHYGFVRLLVEAHAGDIIDVILGVDDTDSSGFPVFSKSGSREVISCICREGENDLSGVLPADCRTVLLYVRKAAGKIFVKSSGFDALVRNINRECAFNCSDGQLNDMWQTGKAVLCRSSVMLNPADGNELHDVGLLDAFLESVNMATVFGDAGFIAARLRQFANSQLENGAIVPLSSGSDYRNSLVHMFFFSGWILYNYRFSSNMVELRNLMPKLDAAKRYLTSLLDEENGLLDPALITPCEDAGTDPLIRNRCPVVMNALFCRFMMSASEIYNLVERVYDARECRRLLRQVSQAMITHFFDEEMGMFADDPIDGNTEMTFSLAGNFFPLLAGIKTVECFEKFVKTFFDFETAEARTIEAESPRFHSLLLEMLFALGQKEWGLRYLRRYWQERMDHNAAALKDPVSGSLLNSRFPGDCSVVPNVFLIREVVGIRIAEPSHSLIYFDPALDHVDYAEAAIPTALGRIHIKWTKQNDGGLEVNIYSSHPVKVMPEFSEALLKKSLFRLSDNVTLVKSAAGGHAGEEEE